MYKNCLGAWLILSLSLPVMAQNQAVGTHGYQCSFAISKGHQSIRYFSLTSKVYRCLMQLDHKDLSIVNRNLQPVPFQITYTGNTVDTIHYNKELEFYQEPAASAYKTGDQIRRIAQLTGLKSGDESDAQWQNKNIYYSSIIFEQKEKSDRLKIITIHIRDNFEAVNATVIVESSNDLQNWTASLKPRNLLFLSGENKNLKSNNLKVNTYKAGKYFRLAALSNIPDFTQFITSIEGTYEKTKSTPPEMQWILPDSLSPLEAENEWVLSLPDLTPVSRIRFTPAEDIVYYRGSIYTEPYIDPATAESARKIRDEGKKKLKNLLKKTVKINRDSSGGGSTSWRYLSGFNQYRIRTETGSLSGSEINLDFIQSKRWRFQFSQPKNLYAIQLPLIELGWQPPKITFIAQGTGPYYLLAGNTQVTKRINFPSQFSSLDNNAQAVNLLASIIIRDGGLKTDDELAGKKQYSWDRILLWSILLTGVALMAVMAYQLSKKLKAH